jgi:hypothetical protein
MNITEKQLAYINFIEEFAPFKFNGETKQEASKYIDENKKYIPLDESENMWSIINGYN